MGTHCTTVQAWVLAKFENGPPKNKLNRHIDDSAFPFSKWAGVEERAARSRARRLAVRRRRRRLSFSSVREVLATPSQKQ